MCVELHHVMPPAMAASFSLIVSQGLYDELLDCCQHGFVSLLLQTCLGVKGWVKNFLHPLDTGWPWPSQSPLPQLLLTASAGGLLHTSCLKLSSLLLGLPLSFFPTQRNRQLVLNYTIENLIVDIPFSLSSSRKAVNLCFLLSRGMLLYKLLVLTSGTQSCLKMLGITLVG